MSGGPATPEFGAGGGEVALHIGEWRDGRWSYLYGADTGYATEEPEAGAIAAAAVRARGGGDVPEQVQGPMIKAPVWTWEVPLYFWVGGIASGAAFVALACDLAGDGRSAQRARLVSLAAVTAAPVLLIMDLGRPLRFLNMLRIFKPRSPMSMGAWCLVAFSSLQGAAVGADRLGRGRAARRLGAATAATGAYLGSYTGVLLATTAVPVWARSRLFLGPIFVATATATGAAACRLALRLPAGHPTHVALGRVQRGAMAAELALSAINEQRLGRFAAPIEDGRPGRLFGAAKWSARAALALGAAERRAPRAGPAASALFLLSGLLFRYGWVQAGPPSARDGYGVALMHRSQPHGH